MNGWGANSLSVGGVPGKKMGKSGNCSLFLAWLGAPPERYACGLEATIHIAMGTCLRTGTVRRRAPPGGPEMWDAGT